MKKVVSVKPIAPFQLWIRFDDGKEGKVDLSHLRGKGVFAAFDDPAFFESVRIDSESRSLAWGNHIDLCADSLYLKMCTQVSEITHQNQNA
jgi:hypothetical protein